MHWSKRFSNSLEYSKSMSKIDNAIGVTKYRPILVLCILSKVFERLILTQLCHYIEVKASYNLTQSGFRKGHSTSTLLLKLRDDIIRAMNTSKVTLGILLDFSKVFYTIDHLTLLQKLYKINFSVEANSELYFRTMAIRTNWW